MFPACVPSRRRQALVYDTVQLVDWPHRWSLSKSLVDVSLGTRVQQKKRSHAPLSCMSGSWRDVYENACDANRWSPENYHDETSSVLHYSRPFCRAMLCVRAVYAVVRCPSVSVCHVRVFFRRWNKVIALKRRRFDERPRISESCLWQRKPGLVHQREPNRIQLYALLNLQPK